jgi:hypothetical protein
MDAEKNVANSSFNHVEEGADANWASQNSDDVAKNGTGALVVLFEPAAQAKIM